MWCQHTVDLSLSWTYTQFPMQSFQLIQALNQTKQVNNEQNILLPLGTTEYPNSILILYLPLYSAPYQRMGYGISAPFLPRRTQLLPCFEQGVWMGWSPEVPASPYQCAVLWNIAGRSTAECRTFQLSVTGIWEARWWWCGNYHVRHPITDFFTTMFFPISSQVLHFPATLWFVAM